MSAEKSSTWRQSEAACGIRSKLAMFMAWKVTVNVELCVYVGWMTATPSGLTERLVDVSMDRWLRSEIPIGSESFNDKLCTCYPSFSASDEEASDLEVYTDIENNFDVADAYSCKDKGKKKLWVWVITSLPPLGWIKKRAIWYRQFLFRH